MTALFFLQWMALGIWFVPLSILLNAHGLGSIKPFAFATSAIAAFISPLIFGALADRHASPVRVLRWLSVASAASMMLTTWSIKEGWPSALVLALIQLQMLCCMPITSISTSIVFSRLRNAQSEFGPIRACGTFGWMCGCWLISALNADASALSGYTGSATWLVLAGLTYFMPDVPPPASTMHVTWRERLGWDALALLKNPDHRVVFITAALFNIPLATLFPCTPPHLQQLGFQHISGWMSLAQVSEVLAMLGLAGLLSNWRLKWIFGAGLGFGLLRFILCALDSKGWVIASVFLHGFAYALYFITAQIYLDERIDTAWRARAQALFTLMTSGVGNLIGYLGGGWWFGACESPSGMKWPLFWGGVATLSGIVMVYFLAAYRGQGTGIMRSKPDQTHG